MVVIHLFSFAAIVFCSHMGAICFMPFSQSAINKDPNPSVICEASQEAAIVANCQIVM